MTQKNLNKLPNSQLEQEISFLRDLPPRDRQAAQRGRDRFLAELQSIEPLTPHQDHRVPLWKTLQTFLFGNGKPGFALSPLVAVFLAVVLLLGSAVTTVFASQSSLPDQALYPVKLWSENIRLRAAGDAQARMQLDQEFADRRMVEIVELAQAGRVIGTGVSDRLQALVDDALRNASALDSVGARKALENLAANLQRHQEQLEKITTQANPNAVAEYTGLVAIFELKYQLALDGSKDPQEVQELRQQMQTKDPDPASNANDVPGKGNVERTPGPDKTVTPAKAENNPPANGNTQGNENGNGLGPQVTRTPPATGPQVPEKTPGGSGNGKGGK